MQVESPELEKRVEEEEDDEDDDDDGDDDGPPPGFRCIVTPQLYQAKKNEVDEEEDEGPPPGFHSTAPKPSPALHSSGWIKLFRFFPAFLYPSLSGLLSIAEFECIALAAIHMCKRMLPVSHRSSQ